MECLLEVADRFIQLPALSHNRAQIVVGFDKVWVQTDRGLELSGCGVPVFAPPERHSEVEVGIIPFCVQLDGIVQLAGGGFYLAAIAVLDLIFIGHAIGLCRAYSDARARACFRYSILYLTLLFAALFADRLLT